MPVNSPKWRAGAEQVEHQPRPVAAAQGVQHRRPFVVQQRAHLRGFMAGGIGGDLRLETAGIVAGENEHCRLEVLVQVGRVDMRGQRGSFGPVRRQQQHFAVAPIHVGHEDRGDRFPRQRFAEDQVTAVQVDADVLFDDFQIAHPVTGIAVEP